ncbi:threonine dehydratase biosynthetic chloroplastic [Phtheirospermum japonicum]|uniref:threonine ammonia-lyase n=1 Tax=Phtheirospermum japonicum TaxID=374723 RepID=A0A830CY48_9LAMI|nr:threonine dehydratase biosynthetic chloroplastic [Phtheirospermum japonicum]
MELLRFAPAQSPLLRAGFFTGNDGAGSANSTSAVRSSRLKPSIHAALSRPAMEILPSVENLPAGALLSPPPPLPVAEKPLLRVSTNSLQCESGYLVPNENPGNGGVRKDTLSAMEYLTNILSSKVYDVAVESPLQLATKLSGRWGVNVWLKREDFQPVFSFKLRGAYNMMAKLPKEQLERGVICSSAGNHAQGVALSAQRLGCDAVIAMPITTPEIKWRSVERLGATVVLVGDSYDEAQSYAKNRAEKEARTFIPPFDHPDVIIGQGTVGMEIVRQMKGPIEAIFVPIGGGGLIAGIAAYVKRVSPDVKIIGVEPFDANAMALSLHHGERVVLDQVGGFADGVAVKVVGEETFRLCKELIDGVVLVSRDAICASIKLPGSWYGCGAWIEAYGSQIWGSRLRHGGIRIPLDLGIRTRSWLVEDMFEEKRSILEPAGALALAGAKAYCKYYGLKGANVVAVTSGANMNFDRLRLVTELADVGRRREAVLATYMPEEPGSFKWFCELLGPMNITEFKYRYNSDKEKALVLYSVGLHTEAELDAMVKNLKSSQLHTINLTENDLVKDHLRHLVSTSNTDKSQLHTINLIENDLVKDHLRHLIDNNSSAVPNSLVLKAEFSKISSRLLAAQTPPLIGQPRSRPLLPQAIPARFYPDNCVESDVPVPKRLRIAVMRGPAVGRSRRIPPRLLT